MGPMAGEVVVSVTVGKPSVGFEGGGDEGSKGGALAEAADGVDSAGEADGVGDGVDALVEAAVRGGGSGILAEEPSPAVGQQLLVVTAAGGRVVAGHVGGEQADGPGGIEEDGGEAVGGEGLGEEAFEGAGLGPEEGARLCVS